MLIGNQCGGVVFYKGGISSSTTSYHNSPIDFSIYPNPSSENLTFSIDAKSKYFNPNLYEVHIYSILGKLVKTISLSGKRTSSSIVGLTNGIYIVNLVSQEGHTRISKKLIIQH